MSNYSFPPHAIARAASASQQKTEAEAHLRMKCARQLRCLFSVEHKLSRVVWTATRRAAGTMPTAIGSSAGSIDPAQPNGDFSTVNLPAVRSICATI